MKVACTTLLLSLCTMSAYPQAGGLHGILGGEREIEAKRTEVSTSTGGEVVVWTTDAVEMPTADKHNDGCARMPEYGDGGICFKVCGGSLTSIPTNWAFQWRLAGKNAAWEACTEAAGCRGFNPQYFEDASRGCGFFMVWKKQSGPRDLRVDVTLGPKTAADLKRIKDREALANRPKETPDPTVNSKGKPRTH